MFTGLIQDVGKISTNVVERSSARITVSTALTPFDIGESIALNGACLTVTEAAGDNFTAFASKETLDRTGLADLRPGSRVNLERAVRVGDPLGGHIVTGHVDARVKLESRSKVGAAERWQLALPDDEALARQVAAKGSVALDGVSLTINAVGSGQFDVMLIPATLEATILAERTPGSQLNLETDVLAKYLARQLDVGAAASEGVTIDLLARSGFLAR
jgi:riboflavin synthase